MFTYKFKTPKKISIGANDIRSALRRYYLKTGATHTIMSTDMSKNNYVFSIHPIEREDKTVIKVKCIGKNLDEKMESKKEDKTKKKKSATKPIDKNKANLKDISTEELMRLAR